MNLVNEYCVGFDRRQQRFIVNVVCVFRAGGKNRGLRTLEYYCIGRRLRSTWEGVRPVPEIAHHI